MLVCILGSFFVSSPSDIQEAVDTRLDGIDTLISQLKGLPRICSIHVDHAIDELLNGCHVLRRAELNWEISKAQTN